MSRIHEALKKAQLERAAAAPPAGATPPPPTPIAAPAREVNSAAPVAEKPVAEKMVAGSTNTATVAAPFRLEDLPRSPAEWQSDARSDAFHPSLGTHCAEQFRTLRSRLYQLRGDQPMRTLLVTSSVAGEGKTFVTSNLARAIVRQMDRRVLVVDGDLRCPRLHAALGANQGPGLTDYLRGAANEQSILQQCKGSHLYLISSGARVNDPSELLSNGRLKTLMDRMAAAFDWILVDSPPCLPVADPGVIAGCCDGVLLVVKAGTTPSALVVRARQELNGKNVAGVVLNAVQEESFAYSSYYGSAYHGSGANAAAAAR